MDDAPRERPLGPSSAVRVTAQAHHRTAGSPSRAGRGTSASHGGERHGGAGHRGEPRVGGRHGGERTGDRTRAAGTAAARDTADVAARDAADAAAKFAYSPALDGMRVICIYVILAGHMGAIRASNVAVDVFFVLSGFLITALLLAERHRTGTVSIGRFLVRRAFRLMPAMWVYLLVGLAVTVAFKWDDTAFRDDYIGSATSAFFNVNNWYKVLHPAAGGRWLAHVWSLSLEEQFYLLWPALFVVVTRSARLRPHLSIILAGLIALVAGWTYVVASDGAPHSRVYLALDTHVAPLLVGCLLAVWRDARLRALSRAEDLTPPVPPAGSGSSRRSGSSARSGASDASSPIPSVSKGQGRRRRHASRGQMGGGAADGRAADGRVAARQTVTAAVAQRWPAGRRIAALGLAAAIGLIVFALAGPNKNVHDANWLDRAAYLPSALLAAIVVLSADLRRDAAWVRLLGRPRMAFLGKMTFSIYLWHYPVISAASGQLVPRIGLWPSVVCAAVISTCIAYFSHRLVERPAQRARPAWADTPRGPARATHTVGAGVAAVAEPASAAAPVHAPARAYAPAPREPHPGGWLEETARLRWRWESADGGQAYERADAVRTGEDTIQLGGRRGTRGPDRASPWPGEPETDDIWVDEGYARTPAGYADYSEQTSPSATDRGYDAPGQAAGPPDHPMRDHYWPGSGWDPVTGPSRPPADPAYLEERYPGELIVQARATDARATDTHALAGDSWYPPRTVARRTSAP
ncbi:acyltransferase [Frankia sp. R82]|uniref:acyltransferase family protein n=1 Tax=Frankia sp. R82 TaxID=2950553 RepID=UPI0020431D42|nr:acyltransferase [Frankia sp. R82]MCM3885430.1 acyltransferase [Frankia sp. R82]